jgi:hypothetical protein
MARALEAMRHIRRMRGGAQSHLMRCSDNNLYVVKFQNNPQHLRVLANEMFATRLAQSVGLPVPQAEVVQVDDWLIERTAELAVQLVHGSIRCTAGRQFGSRYVVDPSDGQVFDYIPVEMLDRVRNMETFAGMLALDKWTGNADGRQAAFWRRGGERKYTAAFIDQGYCFNAGEWSFPDHPLRGIYARNEVYGGVQGWQSFEPWLSRIEGISVDEIWSIAKQLPAEWYDNDSSALEKLVEELFGRRELVRSLIEQFRISPRRPFAGWHEVVKCAQAAAHRL